MPSTVLSAVTDLLMNSFHKFLLGGEAGGAGGADVTRLFTFYRDAGNPRNVRQYTLGPALQKCTADGC